MWPPAVAGQAQSHQIRSRTRRITVASIVKQVTLAADLDTAWKAVADVGAVNKLITFLGEVTFDGERRQCSFGDAVLDELIVDVDHDVHRVAYTITNSPFGFTHHHSVMQVLPEGSGSRLVWTTDFTPDAVAGPLGEALDASATSIADALGH
jgi:Polyketide cyclase / dehydrase and lipid transport